jgi:Methyltransferase domain
MKNQFITYHPISSQAREIVCPQCRQDVFIHHESEPGALTTLECSICHTEQVVNLSTYYSALRNWPSVGHDLRPPGSDIAYHMSTLTRIASFSSVIIEIGCLEGNGSTRALSQGLAHSLKSLVKCMVTVDVVEEHPNERPEHPWWHKVTGDSRHIPTVDAAQALLPAKPDLIYIDTMHTYEQMQAELAVWQTLAVPETIWIFHDTWMNSKYNHMTDAIKEWAAAKYLRYADLSLESHGLGMVCKMDQQVNKFLNCAG